MNNKIFEIRKATKNDIEAINIITKEAFKKYIQLANLSEKINALVETPQDIQKDIQTKEVFIAFLKNTPVGSARVEIFPDNTAYLSRFGVRTKYQNNGVGKALINAIDISMKDKNVKKIYLHTSSKIASLVRFYYSRGFYIDSTCKDKGYIRALLCKEYIIV